MKRFSLSFRMIWDRLTKARRDGRRWKELYVTAKATSTFTYLYEVGSSNRQELEACAALVLFYLTIHSDHSIIDAFDIDDVG